jgi:hypothetical protein
MSTIQHHIKIHSVYKYSGRFALITNFSEAIKLISSNHIKAEIIGQWLYCFTTALIGEQLLSIGFWYSFKHDAYVYSGSQKQGIADDETLDEIRARLGSSKI